MNDISKGNTEKILIWLKSNNSPDEYIADDWTPLTYASLTGRTDIVKLLISNGANINKPEDGGNTPLFWAALGNKRDTVLYLVSAGADTCPAVENRQSPREIAQAKGHLPLLEIIPACQKRDTKVATSGVTK